jgi:arylsulfatase A-like enzyme
VTADHGEALDEHLAARGYGFDHGEFLDAEQIRIPMLLAGPGVAPGRSRGVVSIRDLYATLLAAAALPAGAAGARDLRAASDAPRVALCERRPEASPNDAPTPEAAALVTAHAVAASDGDATAIVGEDGAPAAHAPPALVEAARAVLAARARDARAPEIDAGTREALRSLGYAP